MKISIRKPDDFHLHIRQGKMMEYVLPYSERQFARAIVMPNTKPPLTTPEELFEYRNKILLTNTNLKAFHVLYLTDNTKIEYLEQLKNLKMFLGCKLYPLGVTVNSNEGVSDISKIHKVLKYMEEKDIPLLVHGETTGDIFDREVNFIKNVLFDLCNEYKELRVVLEHITTEYAVQVIQNDLIANLWATITPHHLNITRNDIFKNGLNPHLFCLPIAKTEYDRYALLYAATSNNPKFFAGTDSAPHALKAKRKNGPPGCFIAPSAVEHYAEAFDSVNGLDKLEDFMSTFGARFYGLSLNEETIVLEDYSGHVPYKPYYMLTREDRKSYSSPDLPIPFWSGKYLRWRVTY